MYVLRSHFALAARVVVASLHCCTRVASKWMYISNQIRSMAWKSFCLSGETQHTDEKETREKKTPIRASVHAAYLLLLLRYVCCQIPGIVSATKWASYLCSVSLAYQDLIELSWNIPKLVCALGRSDLECIRFRQSPGYPVYSGLIYFNIRFSSIWEH